MYPPAPQNVQTLHDHMVNWLGRNGYVRPRRDIHYVDGFDDHSGLAGRNTAAIAEDDNIRYAPSVHEGLNYFAARLGRRGWLDGSNPDMMRIALHEILHRPKAGVQFGSAPGQANIEWEEMATESAARDLMPAFLNQMYGHNMGQPYNDGAYSEKVKNFRALSAMGDPVNSRAARLRRREFANNHDERQRLWDEWHAWHRENPR